MILNHKYKFIFLRTGKTAGTSIQFFLSQFCDDRDIISPLIEEDEIFKDKLNIRKAQNYENEYFSLSIKLFKNLMIDFVKGKKLIFHRKFNFYDHTSINEINKYLPKDVLKNYLKFCVVRNPYSFLISQFYWRRMRDMKSDNNENLFEIKKQFDEFVLKCKENFYFQKKIIFNNNKQYGIDKFLYFENIETELDSLIKRLGIKENPKYSLKDFNLKSFNNKNFVKKLIDKKNIEIISKEADYFFEKFNYSKTPPSELMWENKVV
tara:strand:+ start:389 stop:1180 length:792 start_codon:yes stop_codon:yes gene_type:complete